MSTGQPAAGNEDAKPDLGAKRFSSGSHLARNSILNLIGQVVPLLAAFIAMPLLIRGLGTDRFGLLTLAWLLIGYFSFFDLGLGRALTQLVAERISEGNQTQAPPLVWTAMMLMVALGVVAAVALIAIAPWLVHTVMKIPGPLQAESLKSLYFLAAVIPVVVLTTALIGILSAFQRFGTLSAIRAPLGIYTFLAPVGVLPYSRSLVPIIAMLAVGRILACGAHFIGCRDVLPPLRGLSGERASVKPLIRFGAWMTVTNIVAPLMMYLDRVMIGSLLSVGAVAYYATPYEMVTKLLILPNAMLGTLFPAFASTFKQDRDRMARLFVRGTRYVAIMLFPMILVIVAFAQEGLRWWLGEEFALQGASVLRCLAVGVFINGLAQVFATLLHGVGRADLTAKLHLLELPIYLPFLWWSVVHHGVIGAALVWTGRVALDGVLLFWLARRLLANQAVLLRGMAPGMIVALAGLAAPLTVSSPIPRAGLVMAILILFVWAAWSLVDGDERLYFKGVFRRLVRLP